MKMKHRWIHVNRKIQNVSVILLCSSVLFCGCADTHPEQMQEPTTVETQIRTETETVQVTESVPVAEAIPEEDITDGYAVVTPVGTLYYPEEWKNQLTVEINTSDDLYQADFFAVLEHEHVLMFSLLIGDQASGYELGHIVDQDGQETVIAVQITSDQGNKGWTEEEMTRVSEMKERINDILDQIYHLDGFRENCRQ